MEQIPFHIELFGEENIKRINALLKALSNQEGILSRTAG
jgi:hypothetical protein